MTTPEQWLERLQAAERAGTGPPAEVGERVWAQIESRLIDGPAPPELDSDPLLDDGLDPGLDHAVGELAAAAAGKTAGSSLVLKIVAAVALTGVVAGGVALAVRERSTAEAPAAVERQPEVAPQPAPAPEPIVAPASVAPRPDPAPVADVEPEPTPEPVGVVTKPRPKPAPEPKPAAPKTLADEVALMQALSTALKQGDSSKVLGLVAEHEREFPQGQFIEERRAAKARALCSSGKLAAGQKEAESFATRWPKSIHLAAVRQDCGLE